jgi:hypothetical protein
MVKQNYLFKNYLSDCESIAKHSDMSVIDLPKFKQLRISLNSWEVAKCYRDVQNDILSDDLFQLRMHTLLKLVLGGYINVERREKSLSYSQGRKGKKNRAKAHQKEIGYSLASYLHNKEDIYEMLEFIFLDIKPTAPEKFWQVRREKSVLLNDRHGYKVISTFKLPLEYFVEIDYLNKFVFRGEFDLKKINVHFEIILEHNLRDFDLSEVYPLWLAY